MSSAEAMIQADGLTKRYGQFIAVDRVSFSIHPGEVVAFLGPNGAGKSTTMKMLTGFLAPSAGKAIVAGIDVNEDRIAAAEKIGYLPENGPLYTDMTPESLLYFFAQARGIDSKLRSDRINAAMDMTAIHDVGHKRISKLSRGYRQRVGLAQALLHEPDVLILDEPTSGLDPNQIRDIRQAIRKIGSEKTVLLSTHLMQEVEAIATRVLLVNEGKLVFDGNPEQLRSKGKGGMEDAFHELTLAGAGT